jgi:hypothetical protein
VRGGDSSFIGTGARRCQLILICFGLGNTASAATVAPASELEVFVRPGVPNAGAWPHFDAVPRMARELKLRAIRTLQSTEVGNLLALQTFNALAAALTSEGSTQT